LHKYIITALLLLVLAGCVQYGRPIDIPADALQDGADQIGREIPAPTSLFLEDIIIPQPQLTQLPAIYTPSTYDTHAQKLRNAIIQQVCGNQQACPALYDVKTTINIADNLPDQNVRIVNIAERADYAAINIQGAQVLAPGPDLIIESITYFPQAPVIGDTINITVTIKNNGTNTAASSMSRLLHDGIGIGKTVVPQLNSQETHTYTQSIQAGGGMHTIRAIADVQDVVTETDEANNELQIDYQVAAVVALPADLIVETIGHTPLSPAIGDDVVITARIKNNGGQSTPDINTQILLNGGIVSTLATPPLSPGSSDDAQYTIQSIQSGQHTITIRTDVADQVVEQDETNNNKTITISVGNQPDYKPTLIASPQTIQAGIPTAINITTFNIGPAPSPQTTFDIYVDGTKISTRTLPALASGILALPTVHHHTEMITFTQGTHTIRVVVDPQNTIAETNEANNELVASVQTTGAGYLSPKILPPTLSPVSGYAIGTCQNNALVAQLLGNALCATLKQGDGIIKQFSYQGKWIIVLSGATNQDVQNAVDYYINFKQLGPQSIAQEFIFRTPAPYTLQLYAHYKNAGGATKHLLHYNLLGDPTTLVSMPIQPTQKSISYIFGNALADINAIFGFDGKWRIYRQNAPSDLNTINGYTGYFTLMNTQNVPLHLNDIDAAGAATIPSGLIMFSPPKPSTPQDYPFIDTTKPIICQTIASRARGWIFGQKNPTDTIDIGQTCWVTSTGGTI